jgi:hypothetical protein
MTTSRVNGAEVQPLRGQFEAMLLRPALQPLVEAFGDYSDLFVDEFAQVLAKALRT